MSDKKDIGSDTKSKKKIVLIVVTSIIGAVLLALLIFSATLFIMRARQGIVWKLSCA